VEVPVQGGEVEDGAEHLPAGRAGAVAELVATTGDVMPVAPSVQSAQRAPGPVAVGGDDAFAPRGSRVVQATCLHDRLWVTSLTAGRLIRNRSAIADLGIPWEPMFLMANTPLSVGSAVFTSRPFVFPPLTSPATSIVFWEWGPTNRSRGLKPSGLLHLWPTSIGLPMSNPGPAPHPRRRRDGRESVPESFRAAPAPSTEGVRWRQLACGGLPPASIIPNGSDFLGFTIAIFMHPKYYKFGFMKI
jgi:hypothetical protein